MADSLDEAQLRDAGIGAYFRPRDPVSLGVSHRRLQSLVSNGVVENLGNGLYRLSEVEPTEVEAIAKVAAAIPNAVMCLLTALRFHDIGIQSPHETWIALWGGAVYRSTRDLDFTGYGSPRADDVRSTIRSTCPLSFDGECLTRAVNATFERRGTAISQTLPVALTPRFYADADRAERWRNYVSRNDLPGAPLDFGAVGEGLMSFLGEAWIAVARRSLFTGC